ncbi:MAG TPA: BCAM0308 family protein [Nitrospirota bacterium]|nr:BCAM0308 family protein [Nitrospirota bacterium]
MKTAIKSAKTYKLAYKKKSPTTDSYLPRGGMCSISICESCRSVYKNKRWYSAASDYEIARRDKSVATTVCPACMKIRDNFPGGIVTLKGAVVLLHKRDLINLVKNEEERARAFNPLERVISVKENGLGSIVISTTNEKLAQRIGRAVKKAFHGEVTYHWSHDNKLARVDWIKEAV